MSFLVPIVHGIDGLAQLGIVRLVDTTCIDPTIIDAIYPGLSCGTLELVVTPFFARYAFGGLKILISKFTITPSM